MEKETASPVLPSHRHTRTAHSQRLSKTQIIFSNKKNNNKLMFLVVWWCKRGGPRCRLILKEAHLQKKKIMHTHARQFTYLYKL